MSNTPPIVPLTAFRVIETASPCPLHWIGDTCTCAFMGYRTPCPYLTQPEQQESAS